MRVVKGRSRRYDRPDWAPLERLMDAELAGDFTWMYEATTSEGCLQVYKHSMTDRHLVLDDAGRAYKILESDSFCQTPIWQALDDVFCSSTDT